MLKKGIYKCTDGEGMFRYDITIEAHESEKSYVIELIADDSRYPAGQIEMLFRKSKKVTIPKHGGKHPVLNGPDYFVIYPFQAGMPFLFELQESEEGKMISKPRICSKCGCMEWNVTAHVTQGWKVDAFGNFLEETTSCEEVTHAPSEDDLWHCAQCGAEYSPATAPKADKDPEISFWLYERYKVDWLQSHRYMIGEMNKQWAVDDELSELYTPYSYCYLEGVGFIGEIYASYEEFMTSKYLDPQYIRRICPHQDRWLEYVKDLNARL